MKLKKSLNTSLELISRILILTLNIKKIENPELDPYGEDEWGYEEISESLDYLEVINGTAIEVDTQEEYWELMSKLELLGYTWSGDLPTLKNNFRRYSKICIFLERNKIKGDNKYLSYGSYEFFKKNKYNIINYKDIPNKKYKKIDNSESDPYNEEDWGYEEIN